MQGAGAGKAINQHRAIARKFLLTTRQRLERDVQRAWNLASSDFLIGSHIQNHGIALLPDFLEALRIDVDHCRHVEIAGCDRSASKSSEDTDLAVQEQL